MQPGEAARLEAAKNSYADINCSRLHFYLVPLPLSLFSSFLPFGAHLWPIFTGHGFKMRSPGAQNTFSPSRRKLIRERTHPSNAFIRGGKERRSPGATRCTSRVIYRRDCVGKSIDHSGEKKKEGKISGGRVYPSPHGLLKFLTNALAVFRNFSPVPCSLLPPYTAQRRKTNARIIIILRIPLFSVSGSYPMSSRIEGWLFSWEIDSKAIGRCIRDLAFNCVKSFGFVRCPLFFFWSWRDRVNGGFTWPPLLWDE